MVFLHYKWTFYFVLHHRRTVDTKLTPSRLQQTVVIKYERHAAYERINAKTGNHGKTKKQFATTLYVFFFFFFIVGTKTRTYHGMLLVTILMLHLVEFFEAKFV